MAADLPDDFGLDEDYTEEFQDPPLSPCSGDWEADWQGIPLPAIASGNNPERVTEDTVFSPHSSEQWT